MSSVVLRVIECKVNDEWKILPLPTVRKEFYSYIEDKYMPSEKFNDKYFLNYYSEASLWLRDNVFGYGCDNVLKNNGIPKDVSDSVKQILPTNNSVYCITLNELESFINAEESKFKTELNNFMSKKNFKQINDKLDCLLNGEKYIQPSEDEIRDDEEDLRYYEDYIWDEQFNYIISLNCEYHYINNLLYNIFEDWPETRIYYFID